tara:strand:+ start:40 stop:411 length:372 start_codon:yes stop_codon:yes gene_type:complete
MSTLEVSNLNDGTKTVATTNLTNGSAKAWALDATLRSDTPTFTEASFNVSSFTDQGTGNLLINFSNSFSVNNYVGQGTNAGFSVNDIVTCRFADASASRDHVRNYDGAFKDGSINYTAFGDLA